MLNVTASPVSGKELEDRKWIEVRTPNFRISSVLREADTIELAQHLEMFRVAVSRVTNISSTDAPIPTNIYAMRGRGDFKSLGIDPDLGGVFLPGLRANTIVIRDARGMEETSIIMHEYVHFLARNHGRLQYPMWFDEGFAEYLSATRTHFDYFEVGRVPKHRRGSLIYSNWISMRNILSPKDFDRWGGERKAMFYAEAWALVHYLQNRSERDTPFGQDMGHYIELVESGKGDVAAFEEAFGITAKDLNREVKRYLDRGRFFFLQMKIDQLLPDFEPQVIRLSREQASLALAQIALRRGELDQAERWFTIATADEATRPQAEAGRGDVLKFRGEFEAAQPHFETAVALAPSDPYCQLDLAEYWHDRATNPDDTGNRMEYLERARDHYLKAWKLDDSMPEVYAMYGQTFVIEGKRYDKAIDMLEEAEYLLPSNIDVRLMLAEAYLGADRKEDAGDAARSVLAWSHDESDAAKRAREILARLAPE
jgi:tetratricopeptide (TPR) repeat protein